MISFIPPSISLSMHSSRQNIVSALTYTAVGSACAAAFNITTPIGGALFNGTTLIAQYTWTELTKGSEIDGVFKSIFKVVVPILTALGVCLSLGVSLTLARAVELQLVCFLPLLFVGAATNLIPDARLILNS